MEIHHGHMRFWTTYVESREDGYVGFQLHRDSFGKTAVVGQTTYWDATGGFVFATFDGQDVPVEVIEAAVSEARLQIRTK
jgi:hypothetical protein